jgi:hypothetical protein
MPNRHSSKLAIALHDKLLVKFSRPFEWNSVYGYVLDIGPRFFLMAIVGDPVWFNGFSCFRLSDVRKLESPHEYAAFVEAVLSKRGERMPKKPRVSVASIEELLVSAGRAFALVTIHREQVNPDVRQIGRVIGVANGRVELLQIGPDASWDDEPKIYRLSEITRVEFGGDYETALQLVGGSSVVDNQAKWRKLRQSGRKVGSH